MHVQAAAKEMPRWQLTHQDQAQGAHRSGGLRVAELCALLYAVPYLLLSLLYVCAGLLEGVATTAIMRFKDDFVFVCKQDSAGNTVVHGRSKSRLGSSDFGANANRIQQYFKMVEAHLQ
jgi:hypothetical protein